MRFDRPPRLRRREEKSLWIGEKNAHVDHSVLGYLLSSCVTDALEGSRKAKVN